MNDTSRNEAPAGSRPQAGPRRGISRRRRMVLILLTMGIAFIVTLAAIELFLRAFVTVSDVPYVFWDPVVGLRREPNQQGRFISGGYINAEYNFNAQGWNYPEDFTTIKPEGTRRICLVGDSQVEAIQVDVGKNMAVVAQDLMSRPDRPVQWYPFGSSGFGTAEEYELIRHYVLDYKPDIVILLYLQNDPFDCSPYLLRPAPSVPVYYLDEAGQLVLRPAQHWKPVSWRRTGSNIALVRYFVIQKRIMDRLRMIGRGQRQEHQQVALPLREVVDRIEDVARDDLGEMSMEDRYMKTWELTERLFDAARNECKRRGAVFAVAFRGPTQEIDAPLGIDQINVPPREVDPYCLGERTSEMGREIIEPMCRRLDIPFLNLTEPLRAEVERTGQSHRFRDDNHYSELGHRAAGQALAKWAEELLEKQAAQFAD